MASKKKQSEGIALLSMYNDEEDDDMEDVEGGMEGGEQQEQDGGEARIADENLEADTEMLVPDSANEATLPAETDGTIPEKSMFGTSMPQQPSVNMLDSQLDQVVSSRRSRTGTVTIVDYGHDEVAMSPEPEYGGLDGNGRVMFGEELQTTNDGALSGSVQVLTPSSQVNTQFSEPSHTMQFDAVAGSDGEKHGETAQEEQKFVDSLDKFLPPPPRVKCSEDLQRKINKFLEYKRAGKSFNAEVRNRKDYRNPDFLLHAVRYQDIDQIGSCFDKDVFDPHGYDPSDYYDEIEADMRRESDRKEQEKKKAQKVEFASGGAQPGIVTGVPRINVPVAGSTLSSGGLHLMPPTVEATNRDGRQNKKSKWDKVDGDGKNPLASVGQDSVSTGGVHAAILSAANAGGGYMLFAQQKRREAEERRSIERKERRS